MRGRSLLETGSVRPGIEATPNTGAMSSVALGVPIPVNREGTLRGVCVALLIRWDSLGTAEPRSTADWSQVGTIGLACFSAVASSRICATRPIVVRGLEHDFGRLVQPTPSPA